MVCVRLSVKTQFLCFCEICGIWHLHGYIDHDLCPDQMSSFETPLSLHLNPDNPNKINSTLIVEVFKSLPITITT